MTDVKAQELSPDEWCALLEPYGWADITARWIAASRDPSEYEIRVMLKCGPDGDRDEWVQRSDLLDQVRRAVKAVQAKGYVLLGAPYIEFDGRYQYRVDTGAAPVWLAEGRLRFNVAAR